MKNILINKIGARYVCIGKNFRFGKGASGDYGLLKKSAYKYGFKLKAFDVIRIRRIPISSTYIRRAISRGNLAIAEKLLLRRVSILGTVMRGESLGRRIGFPTANINPHHEVLPPPGVYAVKIIFNRKALKGACYIGTKPTLSRKKIIHIEAHIFDFRKNIYGQDLEINFIRKIRDDRKFASLALLAAQIKKDVLLARKLLSLQ